MLIFRQLAFQISFSSSLLNRAIFCIHFILNFQDSCYGYVKPNMLVFQKVIDNQVTFVLESYCFFIKLSFGTTKTTDRSVVFIYSNQLMLF